MDELDLRILDRMGFLPWGRGATGVEALRPTRIAPHVDATAETVRERVARMEEAGVIEGYQVYPSIGQLDAGGAGFVFQVPDPDEKAKAIEEALLVEGVVDVTDFADARMLVTLGYRVASGLERRLEHLARITGDGDPLVVSRQPPEGVDRALSHLDWRIVAALRWDARRSFSDVGEELGVSYRTVKRRVDRMTEEENLTAAPLVEVGRIGGVLPFDLFLELQGEPADHEKTRRRVLDALGERVLQLRAPTMLLPGYVDVVAWVDNLAQVEEIRRRVAELEGIERAITVLTKRSWETRWLDEQIEAKVQATAPG